jgi:hypothetical protein
VEDHCLVLPDLEAEDLLTFLRCLFAPDTAGWDGRLMARLARVGRVIGLAAEGITSFQPEPPPPPPPLANKDPLPPPPSVDKYPKRSRIMAGGGSSSTPLLSSSSGEQLTELFLDEMTNRANSSNNSSGSSNGLADKKCLLKLSEVNLDTVTDEVLTENFCDQDGRLGEFSFNLTVNGYSVVNKKGMFQGSFNTCNIGTVYD